MSSRKKMLRRFNLLVVLIACSSACSNANNKLITNSGETIESVVAELIKGSETDVEKAARIYYFVRDEIKFGWIYPQNVSVDEVLQNRRGVCMQKTNLLVAMAREAGLNARFHFMYVHKTALEDFLAEFAYKRWV